MASNITDYLANKLLDHFMGEADYTAPADVWLALFTTATNNSGGGTEVTGGSYARVQITAAMLAAAASRAITNTSAITFPQATAAWGDITHLAIMDAATSGNMLAQGSATTTQTISTNNIYTVPVGDLDVSFT